MNGLRCACFAFYSPSFASEEKMFALRGMMARVRVTPYRKVLADGSMFTVAVLCYVAYMVLGAPLHGFAKRE